MLKGTGGPRSTEKLTEESVRSFKEKLLLH